ncbi:MAG: recombination protein O N-terminal domain-containing protein [Patescibacteria group bacterium]
MSHRLYSTDAFVVASRDSGESSRMIELFTRDFGLVRGVAQGVRFLKSKLRYSLYPYGYVRTTLVRGREVWRITGAAEIERSAFLDESTELSLMAGFFALLARFVQGEERDQELFDEIVFLRTVVEGGFVKEYSREIELLGTVRILHHLGYLGGTPEAEFLGGAPATARELLSYVRTHRQALSTQVERALSASHL